MKLRDLQNRVFKIAHQVEFGCGNHGCVINPTTGQGTNATCRCTPHHFSELLLQLAADVAPSSRYANFDNTTK